MVEGITGGTENADESNWRGKEKDVKGGCVDQIFAMKRLVERYLGKDKKLYAAFMDLEKPYNRVGREAL